MKKTKYNSPTERMFKKVNTTRLRFKFEMKLFLQKNARCPYFYLELQSYLITSYDSTRIAIMPSFDRTCKQKANEKRTKFIKLR